MCNGCLIEKQNTYARLRPKIGMGMTLLMTSMKSLMQSDVEGDTTIPTTDLTPPHVAIAFIAATFCLVMVAEKKERFKVQPLMSPMALCSHIFTFSHH
jgi:hypothetical protein